MIETIERTTALLAWRPDREPALAAALPALGLDLPPMNRFTESGGLLLARIAPQQALAMRTGADHLLLPELSPLEPHAGLIDLSDSRVAVRIAGPDVRDRLSMLLPLDLHPACFQPGACAQTVMAHLTVLVICLQPDTFELQCGRSFAGSFMRALDTVPLSAA